MPDTHSYAVIWDMDGTMVDTMELHYASWLAMSQELGRPFSPSDFAATFGRHNKAVIRELFGSDYSDEEIAKLAFRKEELYRKQVTGGVELLPGVRELLDGLRAAGYKQAVGSSAPHQNLELILRLNHLENLFAAIVGEEDTTRGKPDPQVFVVAAATLGVPPERCLVLEDAIAGIQAAHAAGMKAIAITHGGTHPDAAFTEAGADLVVNALDQVSVQTVRTLLHIPA